MKVNPKTAWCQYCGDDHDDLQQFAIKTNVMAWMCPDCISAIEKRHKIKAPKLTKKRVEEERRRTEKVVKLMRSRSSKVRELAPGERLPEARSDFSVGSQPLRSKETPMDYHAGFLWSEG